MKLVCESLGCDTTIKVGDRVKSYDFPGTTPERLEQCYQTGVVQGIDGFGFGDCNRYKILVDNIVFRGVSEKPPIGHTIFPPVNGTQSMAGLTNGVVKL